jgi:hypothetical protein
MFFLLKKSSYLYEIKIQVSCLINVTNTCSYRKNGDEKTGFFHACFTEKNRF